MLYVSFGLEKAGSTLTANLTRHILAEAGHPHMEFSAEERNEIKGNGQYNRHGGIVNNVNEWHPDVVSLLDSRVPLERCVLFRTHDGPSQAILDLVDAGRAKCHVALRDLRDVTLSLYDVIARQQQRGRPNHTGIVINEARSVFGAIEENLGYAYAWAKARDAIFLDYENTAFDPTVTISSICEHLGLRIPAERHSAIFAEAAAHKNGKLNVGKPHRHRREMSAEDQQLILDHFADFYARFYPDARVIVDDMAAAESATGA